jgi:SAM-dependent methyltransferase
MKIDLTRTTCVCGAVWNNVEIVGVKDQRTIVRCRTCSLLRTWERDPQYERLYTEGDRYHVERSGQTPYRARYEHDIGIAAIRWPKLVRHTRLLDVGCANGAFVAYAARMGVQAEGLELNPGMALWAREHTQCDVFEHAADPVEMLTYIHRSLRGSGLLVLDVPAADHEDFVKFPMRSHHMKPLEHLWFWDQVNLERILQTHGFVVKEVDRPIPGKLVVYARAN